MLLNLKIPQNPFTTKEPLNLTSPQVIPAPPALWLVSSHLFNPAWSITSAHSPNGSWLGLGLVINHSSPTLYSKTLGNWNGPAVLTGFVFRLLLVILSDGRISCTAFYNYCFMIHVCLSPPNWTFLLLLLRIS